MPINPHGVNIDHLTVAEIIQQAEITYVNGKRKLTMREQTETHGKRKLRKQRPK